MRKSLQRISLCVITAGLGQMLGAAPQPSTAPNSWELTFRYEDPKRIPVMLPGKGKPVVYWYMVYKVQNDTEQEVDFYPSFELVTDTLQVVPSQIRVSPEAYQAIARQAGNELLVPPEKASGRLLRGEDQARYSVAIWPDFDPEARSFRVYVSGLSGEVTRLINPSFDPEKPVSERNQPYFLLRKTLEIPYKLPGSPVTRDAVRPRRVPDGQNWIMR